jgi:pyruvate/2-oxoglutarate dehydrogenase complex dihydrolipoamide acyltransferase (E2) component
LYPSISLQQRITREITRKSSIYLEWYVVEGQMVEEFDELVEVQSDKATVPITSRYAGKILKLHYDVEDMAQVGQPLVDIELAGTDKNEEVDNYVDQIEIETTGNILI